MNAIRSNSVMLRRPIAALVANRLPLRAWTALDTFVRGTGRMEEWSDMADACNLVEALVEMGRYEATSVRPHVDAAIQGLVVAMKCPPGMMRVGSAMPALREVVTLYDDAICKFSAATMEDARRLVIETCFGAKSRSDPTLTVVE